MYRKLYKIMNEIVYILAGIIGLAQVICFFVLCDNVSKINKTLAKWSSKGMPDLESVKEEQEKNNPKNNPVCPSCGKPFYLNVDETIQRLETKEFCAKCPHCEVELKYDSKNEEFITWD